MNQSNLVLTNGDTPVTVDPLMLKKAALTIRALNHKLRQQIVKLIDERKTITVTELYVKMRIEQSVASQHLAILRRAGLVNTKRDGKTIHYSVNYSRVDEVLKLSEKLLN
ncbi:MAG: metalloregulator ArsR/SmtB family transcription factor [Chitinophagales bacterium]|nr:metalloregulator ArsR/SmtB family transcription factor [Chitinophagales bacterium]